MYQKIYMNLFPKVTTPYYVASPPWTHKSSGVRTLHLLVHALNESGQKAYLIPLNGGAYNRNPCLNTPLLDVDHENFYNHAEISPIAVYPDIVIGNPYNCKKVVRYLLAEPRDEVAKYFQPTDKIYHYRSDMGIPTLCLPTFDQSIFYPPAPKEGYCAQGIDGTLYSYTGKLIVARKGTCFYSCKYEAFGNKLLPITENSARLEGTHEYIANILRNAEKCYVYEHSEIAVLAKMCGCQVEEVKTDYWQGTDENWQFANGDMDHWMRNFHDQLVYFIHDTQVWR